MAIEMKIGDIPESAIVSVRDGLKHFLVGIILPAKADAWPVTLIGSGTLVSVQGRHYILTAAHVWSEVKKSKYFQLSFDDRKILFVARTDSVSVEVLEVIVKRSRDRIYLSLGFRKLMPLQYHSESRF